MAQSSTKENVLVLGGTGFIGSHILEQIILAKASLGRIAIFTSPNTVETKAELLSDLKAKGVEVIVGDINKAADLSKAFEGITTVVSAIGRNAIAAQIDWIPLLSSAPSVKRFYPSEYGTDIRYGPSSANEIPHQQKLKVRAALEGTENLGFDYTYLVTGPYADIGGYLSSGKAAPESASYNAISKRAIVIDDGKGRISLTTTRDVGKLLVKSLLHPEASRNRALIVNSFTTTPLEIIAEFEKQTGGEKWEVLHTPMAKLKELEEKAWADKSPVATLFTLKRIWAEGGTLYEKRDNGLVDGEDTDSLADAVRISIEAQKAAS